MRLICERCTDSTHLPEFTGIVVVQLIPDPKRCDVKVKSWYFHTTIPYEWSEFRSKTHRIWNRGLLYHMNGVSSSRKLIGFGTGADPLPMFFFPELTPCMRYP